MMEYDADDQPIKAPKLDSAGDDMSTNGLYRESDSLHITGDWDTLIDDYYDDYDDFLDFEPPMIDDSF